MLQSRAERRILGLPKERMSVKTCKEKEPAMIESMIGLLICLLVGGLRHIIKARLQNEIEQNKAALQIERLKKSSGGFYA